MSCYGVVGFCGVGVVVGGFRGGGIWEHRPGQMGVTWWEQRGPERGRDLKNHPEERKRREDPDSETEPDRETAKGNQETQERRKKHA